MSNTALMFVANSTALTADESAIQTRLQNLGLTVVIKQYNSSPPSAATMATYNLLVFTTASQDKTPGSTTYGVDVYDSYAIPRLSTNNGCRPHSKFASSAAGGGSAGTQRYVMNTGGPIVAGISITPPGLVNWYDTASLSNYYYTVANLGSGAVEFLAQSSSGASTRSYGTRYDVNGILSDGTTPAPARMLAIDLFHFSNAVAEPDAMKMFDNSVNWLLPVTNQPPTGNIASQTVVPGATVTLDASTITDPEGQVMTYSWTPPAGVTLSSNTAQTPTFTAGAAGSSYSFSCVITDSAHNSITRTCTVTVLASGMYSKGREGILDESIKMNSGTVSIAMVDTTTLQGYSPNLATDQFLSDIPSNAVIAQVSLGGKAFTGGVFDANDAAFASPPSGRKASALVVYQDTGTATTSRLVAYLSQGTGFPITTAGTAVNITWDNGSNKIFAL